MSLSFFDRSSVRLFKFSSVVVIVSSLLSIKSLVFVSTLLRLSRVVVIISPLPLKLARISFNLLIVTPKLSVIGVAFSSSSDKPPAISDMIVSPSFIGELMSPIDRTIALLPRKSLLLSVALEFIPMMRSLSISIETKILLSLS